MMVLLSFTLCWYLMCVSMATIPFSEIVQLHNDWCSPSCATSNSGSDFSNCCGNCECDKEDCYEFGTCCLNAFDSLTSSRRSLDETLYGCVRTDLYGDSNVFDDNNVGFWLINRCNSSNPDPTIKELCEQPDAEKSLMSLVPVTDQTHHYKNQFCAMCNDNADLTSIIRWRSDIVCETPETQTYDNILRLVKGGLCNITFIPPDKPIVSRCFIYLISSCNVTGLWQEYDGDTEVACNSFRDVFNSTFQNVFCYICNTEQKVSIDNRNCSSLSVAVGIVATFSPPFLALLDLTAVSRTFSSTELHCDINIQFQDDTAGICRDIQCDAGKYLSFDGMCSQIPEYQNPLCYLMFLKLTIISGDLPQRHLEDLAMDFALMIRSSLQAKTEVYLAESLSYIVIKIITDNATLVSEMLENQKNLSYSSINGIKLVAGMVSYNGSLFHSQTRLEVVNKDFTKDVLNKLDLQVFESPEELDLCTEKKIVPGDRLLKCPFIKLAYKNLSMNVTNGFLFFEETDIGPLSRLEYRSIDGDILICLSNFKDIYHLLPYPFMQLKESASFIHEISAKTLLSLICVCTSIVCLLITAVYFVLSADRHSLPGYNTIFLCTCLLLAQTVYQFGIGQTSLPNWACSFMGGVCHFLWMSVMFSMNVCSLDMFLVFRKLNVMRSKSVWKKLIKRIMYVCSLSLLFVALNIGVSLSMSRGHNVGYGGLICYFSNRLMQIVSFIIPSILIIVTNVIVFIFVVFRISRSVIDSAGLKVERNYFDIYVRLSTLTGFTWIVGFLLLFVKSEVLEYCFILFNASQGVFIMVAFIFNRRLWRSCYKKHSVSS